MLNITKLYSVDPDLITTSIKLKFFELSRSWVGRELSFEDKVSIAHLMKSISKRDNRIINNAVRYCNGEIGSKEEQKTRAGIEATMDKTCKKHNLRYELDNTVAGIRLYNGEHELTFLLNK